MNRRTALTMISAGAATCGAGCLSIEEAGPIDFELLNFTEDTCQVKVTITDEGGNTVLEEPYEIEERKDGPRVIREEGFTEVTNGETLDIVVAPSDREPEERVFAAAVSNHTISSAIAFFHGQNGSTYITCTEREFHVQL